MTDEDIRVWIAFALLDGIAAWWNLPFKKQQALVELGYINVRASKQRGHNELIVTNMGRQFLQENNHGKH